MRGAAGLRRPIRSVRSRRPGALDRKSGLIGAVDSPVMRNGVGGAPPAVKAEICEGMDVPFIEHDPERRAGGEGVIGAEPRRVAALVVRGHDGTAGVSAARREEAA